MRDFSQTDLIDIINERHRHADDALEDRADQEPCPAIINWLGARKPLTLICIACAAIAVMRFAFELML